MIEFVLFILFKSGSEFNVVLNDVCEGEINRNKDSIEINYIICRVIWAFYNIKNHDILKITIIMI